MNKVDQVKHAGIDVDALDDNYADLNDEDDVVVSLGERGPSIHLSERAMTRLYQPWKNT